MPIPRVGKHLSLQGWLIFGNTAIVFIELITQEIWQSVLAGILMDEVLIDVEEQHVVQNVNQFIANRAIIVKLNYKLKRLKPLHFYKSEGEHWFNNAFWLKSSIKSNEIWINKFSDRTLHYIIHMYQTWEYIIKLLVYLISRKWAFTSIPSISVLLSSATTVTDNNWIKNK